jgi:hypothetical protein
MGVSELRTATQDYWHEPGNDTLINQMRRYVCESLRRLDNQSLMQAELAEARKDPERIKAQRCETLVLLVGFSLEPLLQSVCVYKPEKIILVLNRDYAGEEGAVFATHIKESIGYLVEKRLITQLPEFVHDPGYVVPGDDPASVFKTLVGALHDVSDVVIDVTGGKKSMVAGAFLYAAYAGAPISYVDFDEYDPKYRRPYGYSCRIGVIANPYKHFALHEWQQVRDLYTHYKFREARETLKGLWQNVKSYFDQKAGPAVQKMLSVFQCYVEWESGRYNEAQATAQAIPGFTPPKVVSAWGGQWFKISGRGFTVVPRFYADSDKLRVYVCDELARICRLIEYNADYRSAFLRAGSLNEVIMLARLVKLVPEPDKTTLLNALDEETPNAGNVFRAMLNLDKGLNPKSSSRIRMNKDITFRRTQNPPTFTITLLPPMKRWWTKTTLFNAQNGWEDFLHRRNDLAHKYYSPPREWAEDALRFVTANLEDFLGHSIADLNFNTAALPWSELCVLCGLDRYLPPNLR